MKNSCIVIAAAWLMLIGDVASAEDGARAVEEPGLDAPTLMSLGVYWRIDGDENKNAVVDFAYRARGEEQWREGMPLWRSVAGPKDTSEMIAARPTFAGSALLLEPGTNYDLRLRLRDPDGGDVEKILTAATLSEPVLPAQHRVRHVAPGNGGGSGTEANPFLGIEAANAAAAPGDVFVLRPGVYQGQFVFSASGEHAKPIVWRGSTDGQTILDAGSQPWKGVGTGYGGERDKSKDTTVVRAEDLQHVWFENLTIQNGTFGVVANRSANLVIRRCHIRNINYAITAVGKNDSVNGFFVTDNVIDGPSTQRVPKGPWDARGIEIGGTGHVVAWNKIRGFSDDMIAVAQGSVSAIDIHNNDLGLATEGIEMDYLQRNGRCFHNRISQVYNGISSQPVAGGPVYVFRNVLYGVTGETFKIRNTSGLLMAHNTSVRAGSAIALWSPSEVRNCWSRNNLYVGTEGSTGYDCSLTISNCDFDYDAIVGGPWQSMIKWNKIRYGSLAEAQTGSGNFAHAVVTSENVFAAGTKPPEESVSPDAPFDLQLRAGSPVVDAGEKLPGLNDGHSGSAPDLGAYEMNSAIPHYGPRK